MINANQIIENVTNKNSNQNYDDLNSYSTADSLLRVRVLTSDLHDSLVKFLNLNTPGNTNQTLWSSLLKTVKGVSKYRQFEDVNWTRKGDFWETTIIIYGSPLDVISKIRKLPLFNFESQNFYFDTEQKFGYLAYGPRYGDKWFIRKNCDGYFKVFTHYLRVFKEHLDEGNTFDTNLVERLGRRIVKCVGSNLGEEWDNDLYFDLSPELNLSDYLDSLIQIKELNSEVRDKIEETFQEPRTDQGGRIDLTDLNQSITKLSEALKESSSLESVL